MTDRHRALALFPQDEQGVIFLLARGRAVESYALYEQSLAWFYSSLMGVSQDFAGVTFFRINNGRARLAILERLLKKRHGSTFNIFWNSLVKLLQSLDENRNHIVHWTSVEELDGKSRTSTLAPPNHWDRTEDTPKIVLNDLYEFILKCDFYSRLINIFNWAAIDETLQSKHAADYIATWREIFQQPVTYPPPDNHPLYRKT